MTLVLHHRVALELYVVQEVAERLVNANLAYEATHTLVVAQNVSPTRTALQTAHVWDLIVAIRVKERAVSEQNVKLSTTSHYAHVLLEREEMHLNAAMQYHQVNTRTCNLNIDLIDQKLTYLLPNLFY